MPGIFSRIRFWAKLLSGRGQREYTVPFFWPRFDQSQIHTSSLVGGIISRGEHISRSNVKRAVRFSVLAFRTVTETLGSSREKAAGEKLAKPRIRDHCVRSTPVVLSGSDLAKPRAENDILASFFFFFSPLLSQSLSLGSVMV
jgi:hypothetical protein